MGTMPVTLDNIQFYHGPSKPAKRPYLAFNSNKSGLNAMSSSERLSFFDEAVPLVTDNSLIAPNCFYSPDANADDTTHQHAVRSPNLFDSELARSWGTEMPLSNIRDTSARDTCPSLQELDSQHQGGFIEKMPGDVPSTLGADSSEGTELYDPVLFTRTNSVYTSPPPPPLSPSIAVLSPEPFISVPEIMQSHVVGVAQWRQNKPSYSASESFTPAQSWDTSDVSIALGENPSSTPHSPTSFCSNAASKEGDDRSSCDSLPVDCSDDISDDYERLSQTGLISDCLIRSVPESEPSRTITGLPVKMPNSMDFDQASRCRSAYSHSRISTAQCDENSGWPIPRKRQSKERSISSTRKHEPHHKRYQSFIAVVIPSPRPRLLRNVRLKTKPVPADVNESEITEDLDNSSDEDFTNKIQSELSDIEDFSTEEHSLPSIATPCHPHDVSIGSSTSYFESRDIIGRAILTIETQGSEPTFFFTLMPDNVRSTSHTPVQRLPDNPAKPGGIHKQPRSKDISTRGKGKCRTYSTQENKLLVKLKEQRKLKWEDIADHFPNRTSSALQMHYRTKLRSRKAKKKGHVKS